MSLFRTCQMADAKSDRAAADRQPSLADSQLGIRFGLRDTSLLYACLVSPFRHIAGKKLAIRNKAKAHGMPGFPYDPAFVHLD